MTPEARVQAAAEVLDAILAGAVAERALTGWARGHRFAGSKDRAAIRDHVFDALRRRRSLAALGGADSGRGLMLGAVLAAGSAPEAVFSGQGHAPAPLTPAERAACGKPAPEGSAAALDCPDWLMAPLARALGPERDAVLAALQRRAPLHLRVNLVRTDRAAAAAALVAEGIATAAHPLSPSALEVTGGARRLRHARAYADGLVELQDAASQAAADLLPLPGTGGRVLDYCAGGGGKALALAARAPQARIFAHDAQRARMRDLPARAARAGARIDCVGGDEAARQAPFDAVFVDAPCSGSGAWQRDPQGKWRLGPADLARLVELQADILDRAAALTVPGGGLVYATCSLLGEENQTRVSAFLQRHPGWRQRALLRTTPLDGASGFFAALLTK